MKIVELDLMGPFICHSDVNKRSTMKVWGAVTDEAGNELKLVETDG